MTSKPYPSPREQVVAKCKKLFKDLFNKEFDNSELNDMVSEVLTKKMIPEGVMLADEATNLVYDQVIILTLVKEIKSLKEKNKKLKQYHNCPDCAADEIKYENIKSNTHR